MADNYVIEMLHITKEFPGIKANDDITLQLRKGEIHALLGENGAGKSTLMSVLFGLYQPEQGTIRKNGQEVKINNPNDANALGIGMVHQHFKLVECFTVLDNIILGVEDTKHGFLQKDEARKKVMALSEKYGLKVDPDALVSDISVGMQQRVEILKMLYRDNESSTSSSASTPWTAQASSTVSPWEAMQPRQCIPVDRKMGTQPWVGSLFRISAMMVFFVTVMRVSPL